MKYVWQELPKPLNVFTVRGAAMVNLNTGKIERSYSANTKLVMYQKCVTPEKTFYRTYSAFHHDLNWAFEASAFGLPNEKASLAPAINNFPNTPKPAIHTLKKAGKKTNIEKKTKTPVAKSEGQRSKKSAIEKILEVFKWRKH